MILTGIILSERSQSQRLDIMRPFTWYLHEKAKYGDGNGSAVARDERVRVAPPHGGISALIEQFCVLIVVASMC